MTIAGVLFDLDGTLIDSTEAIVDCFFHTFDRLEQVRPPREAIVSTISLTLENQFATMTDHDPNKAAKIFRERYFRIGPDMTTLHPGAEDILQHCGNARVRTGFVTSKLRVASELLLDRLGVLHHFEARIGPEDVTHPKPHPEPLLKAMDILGLTPLNTVYLGDTPLDIRAATAAGMRSVALSSGYATEEALHGHNPTVICANLVEAAEWLVENGLETR